MTAARHRRPRPGPPLGSNQTAGRSCKRSFEPFTEDEIALAAGFFERSTDFLVPPELFEGNSVEHSGSYARRPDGTARGRASATWKAEVAAGKERPIALSTRHPVPCVLSLPAKKQCTKGRPPGGHLTQWVAGSCLLRGRFGLFRSQPAGDRQHCALPIAWSFCTGSEQSRIYAICDPGRFMVFVDPAIPVLTPESMGENWVVLCQDEVYVRDRVPVERLVGVIVHPADADSVMNCMADLQRLGIPVYDADGKVLWPPA